MTGHPGVTQAATVHRGGVAVAPAWLDELVPESDLQPFPLQHDLIRLRLGGNRSFCRIEASFDGVRSMDILTLQQTVSECYHAVLDLLGTLPTPHAVRLWAFVPEIHAEMGPGLDRYMAFNAGRFAAFSAWCGGKEAFGSLLATASAVGVEGDRLVLHCLGSAERGSPVENPRQIPAYRYSRQYGPLPPCFARGTRIGATPWAQETLLAGGTASIRGEVSLHVGDLARQCEETFRNLASLVGSALGAEVSEDSDPLDGDWLARYRDVRIYRPRQGDTDAILAAVSAHFPALSRVEVLDAHLCRAELRVEIEAIADLH